MLLIYLLKLLFTNPAAFLLAILILILPLLISITVHEWAHGFTAYKFGDSTPKDQGRLTLNPFAHLDLVGTLMLFIVGIGWAKPVQINPENIPGKTKQMLVAIAGPVSNFTLAILFSLITFIIAEVTDTNLMNPQDGLMALLIVLLHFVVRINIILGIFNMLPIPPLDGSNFVKWLLPEDAANAYYSRLAPFGLLFLLILLFTGAIDYIFRAAAVVEDWIMTGIQFILGPIF